MRLLIRREGIPIPVKVGEALKFTLPLLVAFGLSYFSFVFLFDTYHSFQSGVDLEDDIDVVLDKVEKAYLKKSLFLGGELNDETQSFFREQSKPVVQAIHNIHTNIVNRNNSAASNSPKIPESQRTEQACKDIALYINGIPRGADLENAATKYSVVNPILEWRYVKDNKLILIGLHCNILTELYKTINPLAEIANSENHIVLDDWWVTVDRPSVGLIQTYVASPVHEASFKEENVALDSRPWKAAYDSNTYFGQHASQSNNKVDSMDSDIKCIVSQPYSSTLQGDGYSIRTLVCMTELVYLTIDESSESSKGTPKVVEQNETLYVGLDYSFNLKWLQSSVSNAKTRENESKIVKVLPTANEAYFCHLPFSKILFQNKKSNCTFSALYSGMLYFPILVFFLIFTRKYSFQWKLMLENEDVKDDPPPCKKQYIMPTLGILTIFRNVSRLFPDKNYRASEIPAPNYKEVYELWHLKVILYVKFVGMLGYVRFPLWGISLQNILACWFSLGSSEFKPTNVLKDALSKVFLNESATEANKAIKHLMRTKSTGEFVVEFDKSLPIVYRRLTEEIREARYALSDRGKISSAVLDLTSLTANSRLYLEEMKPGYAVTNDAIGVYQALGKYQSEFHVKGVLYSEYLESLVEHVDVDEHLENWLTLGKNIERILIFKDFDSYQAGIEKIEPLLQRCIKKGVTFYAIWLNGEGSLKSRSIEIEQDARRADFAILSFNNKNHLVFTSKGVVYGAKLSHQQPTQHVLQVSAEISWLDDTAIRHLYLFNSLKKDAVEITLEPKSKNPTSSD
ncbi:hypothetical protein [Rheinheimera sp.]|uniref:hypothetical protein n=1 Tax=Rheinheimera sp. TaxID=1869214 RepID=UPI0027342A8F|nr:hypothetical protein [Rheinheimera sp.]MDP2713805.1 hypothetical protein [Rheinheimera sp.]